jgi:hypothetical protein
MITKLREKPRERLKRIVGEIRSKKFKYKPRAKRDIEWIAYLKAQVNEVNDYLTVVREIVDEAERRIGFLPPPRTRRPPKSAFDKAKAILVQHFFGVQQPRCRGLCQAFQREARNR